MSREIDCPNSSSTIKLRAESLPFSAIPGQSRLFIEYQQDPLSLRAYYPNAVESHMQIADRIPEVLENYKTDRGSLCDALESINRAYDAPEEVIENIKQLREQATVAVVTGQQAGLFSGPIYTIYKALSVIRMAECLNARGFKAVPVFWAATEDHDFEEVSEAFAIDGDGKLLRSRFLPDEASNDLSVGAVRIDGSINETIETMFRDLPKTEFSDGLRDLLAECWSENAGFGEALGKFLVNLLGGYGLVVIDPLHEGIKKLAAPVYVDAIHRSGEIVSSLIERSRDLERNRYHAQVLVAEDYFPLFWHSDSGKRQALRNAGDSYKLAGEKREFTRSELAKIAASEPGRFSPGVMLRPVVQDYLLPTVCYFGGGAEIAYFAQNSEVYRVMNRPVTPILHRQSFTVIEAKHARTMEKYGLDFEDLFSGIEKILPKVIEEHIDPDMAKIFAEAEEKINTELNRLDQHLARLDQTVAESLATRRRKILYHIAALRKKAYFARIRKDETINSQIESAFTAVLPRKQLQERTLNIGTFLNRYGMYFIDWLYRAIDLEDKDHRVIYL